MARDTSVGACIRRMHDLGYAIASATNPDRTQGLSFTDYGARKQMWALKKDPAAVLTYPTAYFAPELQDSSEPNTARTRGIVPLVVTAYLLQSDPRQFRAVMSVLERHKLTTGPFQLDSFGNRTYVVQWNEREPLLRGYSARTAHPDDDATVIIKPQATEAQPFGQSIACLQGYHVNVPANEMGSYIVPLDGEWKGGHLLDTPRSDLPELLADDVREIIGDIERARWGARPAAKEAA